MTINQLQHDLLNQISQAGKEGLYTSQLAAIFDKHKIEDLMENLRSLDDQGLIIFNIIDYSKDRHQLTPSHLVVITDNGKTVIGEGQG